MTGAESLREEVVHIPEEHETWIGLVLPNGEIAAYIDVVAGEKEVTVLEVGVRPRCRRRGLAARLMARVVAMSRCGRATTSP